jgi:hypothetical protein
MSLEQSLPVFNFVESLQFKVDSISREDFLPDSQCFVLYNVFDQEECQQLIEQGEEFGFLDLSSSYEKSYRSNQRIVHHNQTFQEVLWGRISDYVEDTIEMQGKHPTLYSTYFTDGIWGKDQLNENLRLCKYHPGNFFKKHCDEGYHPNPPSHRSLKTCMIYLNNEFEGGETVFYFKDNEDNHRELRLHPSIGMCLIFNQNILHEGLLVQSGYKYFIRTDILFKKIHSTIDLQLNQEQWEAVKCYQFALDAEQQGDQEEATKCYRRATKLFDDIETLYNSLYG